MLKSTDESEIPQNLKSLFQRYLFHFSLNGLNQQLVYGKGFGKKPSSFASKTWQVSKIKFISKAKYLFFQIPNSPYYLFELFHHGLNRKLFHLGGFVDRNKMVADPCAGSNFQKCQRNLSFILPRYLHPIFV